MKITKSILQKIIKESIEDEIDADRASQGLPPYEEDEAQQGIERRADEIVDDVMKKVSSALWSALDTGHNPEQFERIKHYIELELEEPLLDMALVVAKHELDEPLEEANVEQLEES
jgi:hypothetical protein